MPRQVSIPLYDGSDFETMADLRRKVAVAEQNLDFEEQIAEAEAGRPKRMGDDAPSGLLDARKALQAARDLFDAFVDEACDRAEMWVLNPIGHEDWRKLVAEHPARKVPGEDGEETTHPDDEGFEFNTETLPKELLRWVDPEDDEFRTVVEPKFSGEREFHRRLRRLADGEFETLWLAAHQLNTGLVSDPKALRFSADARSDAT